MPPNIFFMYCIFHFRGQVLIVHQNSTKVLKIAVIWDVMLCSLVDVIFVEEPPTSIFRTEKTTPTLKMEVTGFAEHCYLCTKPQHPRRK